MMRKTSDEIKAHKGRIKEGAEPLVCLTAYTARVAQVLDPHCDLLLVGDSLGMVLYGLENTRGVDLDTMIRHGQAVMRGSQQACVIVDLPFGTYEDNAQQALSNARRVMDKTGCSGVKLEGGMEITPQIEALVSAGIPVIGHIGLMPQSVEDAAGFRVQGRTQDAQTRLLADAVAVEKAGASALVIEATLAQVSEEITASVSIPTIGIGASPTCDGQILVTEDMLGITGDHVPKFVKQYANISTDIERAVSQYAQDVRSRVFPGVENVYQKKAS